MGSSFQLLEKETPGPKLLAQMPGIHVEPVGNPTVTPIVTLKVTLV